jgi:hypothetical protein
MTMLLSGTLSAAIAQEPCTTRMDDSTPGESTSIEISLLEEIGIPESPDSEKSFRKNVDRLLQRWSRFDEQLPSDSDTTEIVRVWRDVVVDAGVCLEELLEIGPSGRGDKGGSLDRCLEMSRNVETLLPVLDTIAKAGRSAVLVFTSVGCQCTLEACARMNTLFDDLRASNPAMPLARVDEMVLPEISEEWDLLDYPSWIFLGPLGDVQLVIEAKSETNAVMQEELESWLTPARR